MGAYTDPYQAGVMVDFAMQELGRNDSRGPHRNR